VLCEKPIALNAEEAEEMVRACADAGVLLAEAFMYRHHPRYHRIKEIIRSGEIGTIRGIHGAFTFNNSAQSSNVRFHRDMGGGAIYDVGCYPISAARLILEREPEAATVHAFLSPQHDLVDMMASGLVEFSDSVALTFDCGMWAASRNVLEILGRPNRAAVRLCQQAGQLIELHCARQRETPGRRSAGCQPLCAAGRRYRQCRITRQAALVLAR
jgi:predicted dehydrogenase